MARSLPDLAKAWLELWNGNLDLLPSSVAEDIVIHSVSPDGGRLETLRGRETLGGVIRQTHACFDERTTYEVGPIVQDPFFVVRWHSIGRYRGGMPGVPPQAAGRGIDFRGIDIVRVEGGMAAEFWMSLDLTVLVGQFGGAAA